MSNMEIKIDATDWYEQVLREETIIADDDAILELVRKGESLSKIAVATIVNRELHNCDADIIKPNKLCLMSGATADIAAKVRSERTLIEVPSGATYSARSLVGSVTEPPESGDETNGGGEGYVELYDREALSRAVEYLERIAPGVIWSRLLIVVANNGDVENEADKLKCAIDEMVSKLT